MKSKTRFLTLLLFIQSLSLMAQSPQGIQFQGLARDGTGTPINNASISVDFRIQDGSAVTVYHETHSTTTDAYGLFNLVIGQGTVNSGTFSTISWGSSAHQVQIDIDAGAGYVPMGVCNFQSVPYALYAENGSVWAENGSAAYFDQGRVGIGVDTPSATLHLRDTSEVLFGAGTTVPGYNFLYHGPKGALRSGRLISAFQNVWDVDSMGLASVGLGLAPKAKGIYSVALGQYPQAIGPRSFAFNGDALGEGAVNMGFEGIAAGEHAFVGGFQCEANGNFSAAYGARVKAETYASFSVGLYNYDPGSPTAWIMTDPAFIVGNGTGDLNRHNAMLVQKNGQTSIGYDTPTGMLQVSTALGDLNNAGVLDVNNATLLLGLPTNGIAMDANQIESISSPLVLNANSTQNIQMAQGGGSVGIGQPSPAAKLDIRDSGWHFRLQNTDTGGNDWLIGASSDSWNIGGDRFVISRSTNSLNHVLVIEESEQVGIGNGSPQARLQVDADNGEDALRVRVDGQTRLMVHDNGGVSIGLNQTPPVDGLTIGGITQPAVDNAYTIGSSGRRWSAVYATNGTIQTSDIRLKQNIQNSPYGLDEVLQFRPVHFEWKDASMPQGKIGFIAQELQEIVPEVVQGNEAEEMLGVNYAELVPVLVKAIQEQQDQMQTFQQELLLLRGQNEALQTKINELAKTE